MLFFRFLFYFPTKKRRNNQFQFFPKVFFPKENVCKHQHQVFGFRRTYVHWQWRPSCHCGRLHALTTHLWITQMLAWRKHELDPKIGSPLCFSPPTKSWRWRRIFARQYPEMPEEHWKWEVHSNGDRLCFWVQNVNYKKNCLTFFCANLRIKKIEKLGFFLFFFLFFLFFLSFFSFLLLLLFSFLLLLLFSKHFFKPFLKKKKGRMEEECLIYVLPCVCVCVCVNEKNLLFLFASLYIFHSLLLVF